jgi:hypothetical protein
MAKNIETVAVSTRAPTAQQQMLIDLATRKDGVTRAEVRTALGYEDGANIPVQTMLKTIATRFGLVFENELFEVEGSNRKVAFYTMRAPATAAKAKRAAALKTAPAPKKAAATKATKAATKAAVIVTAKAPKRGAKHAA